MTIPTTALHDTATASLGQHTPKPTAVSEGLTEATLQVWAEGKIDTGLWECGVGSFTAERIGYTEICTVISGRVTLDVEGAESVTFGPGDIMVMPSGWKGTWHVHEPLRKHYTTVDD